jgi:hypothetical protein
VSTKNDLRNINPVIIKTNKLKYDISIILIYLMSVGNESTTYLRGLEVAELKEEDMPMV